MKLEIIEGINESWSIETSCHTHEYDKTLSNNTEIEYSVLELWFCCVMKNKSGDILFFRLP